MAKERGEGSSHEPLEVEGMPGGGEENANSSTWLGKAEFIAVFVLHGSDGQAVRNLPGCL